MANRIKIARGSQNKLPGALDSDTLLYGELFWAKEESGVSKGVLYIGHPDGIEDGTNDKAPLPVAGARAMKSLYFEGLFDPSSGTYPTGAVVGSFWVCSANGAGNTETFHFGDWMICITVNPDNSTQWIKSINQAITTQDPLSLEKNPLDLTAGVIKLKYDGATLDLTPDGKLTVKTYEVYEIASGATITEYTAVALDGTGAAILADYSSDLTSGLVGIAIGLHAPLVDVQKFGRVINAAFAFADIGGPVYLGAGGALVQGTENITSGHVVLQVGTAIAADLLEINIGTPFLMDLPSDVYYIPLTNKISQGDVGHAPTADAVFRMIAGNELPTFGEDILPSQDNVFDIGGPTLRFKDLYADNIHAGAGSVHIGALALEQDGNGLFVCSEPTGPGGSLVTHKVILEPDLAALALTGLTGFTADTVIGALNELKSNEYTLPTATATVLGGIKIGSGLTISSGVVSASSTSMGDRRQTTGIIIPMYVYPTNIYPGDTVYHNLVALAKQYHNVPMVVIVNPASGPGTVVDGNYTGAIELLQGAGITVLGYIHITQAARAVAAVVTDINNWKTLYPAVDGIWIDEFPQGTTSATATDTSVAETNLQYIQALRDAANANGLSWVFGNQGAPSSYNGMAYVSAGVIDKICIWEDSTAPAATDLGSIGDWYPSFETTDYSKRIAITHSQASFNLSTVLTMAQYTSYFYYTDSTTPYSTISAYLPTILPYLGYNIATTSIPGIVKVGAGLSVAADGTLTPAATGVTAGSASSGFINYNGTVQAAGQLDGGTTPPSHTTQLNYDGELHATKFVGKLGELDSLTQNIIPDVDNAQDLGSPTKYFANGYVKEMHIGTSSLYVNGTKVISDATTNMKFSSDIDQGIQIQAVASVQGTGNANVILQADNLVQVTGLGGVAFNVPATISGKDISFSNASTGGMIRFNGPVVYTGNVEVAGNLTVTGTTTTINVDQVTIKDNLITINSNQIGIPATTLTSGIDVERGDETNYRFVFVELDNSFKIGQIGSLQSVATREDTPTTSGTPFWNPTAYRFDTASSYTFNSTTGIVSATGFSGSGAALSGTAASLSIGGNAATATKLATTRAISLSGGVTGSGSFDGSGDLSIATTVVGIPAGLTAGSASSGFINYNGTAAAAGQLDGGSTVPTATNRLNYGGYFYATRMYGAVWNDVVDFLEVPEDTDVEQYGKVYVENEDGSYSPASSYMAEGIIGLASDTFGLSTGTKPGVNQLPISIGGFVLAEVDQIYRAGTPLTTSPTGGLTKMIQEDKLAYPERIVATFLRPETAVEWNGILVNNRHWVKVR
jgi:hypothetical protein